MNKNYGVWIKFREEEEPSEERKKMIEEAIERSIREKSFVSLLYEDVNGHGIWVRHDTVPPRTTIREKCCECDEVLFDLKMPFILFLPWAEKEITIKEFCDDFVLDKENEQYELLKWLKTYYLLHLREHE